MYDNNTYPDVIPKQPKNEKSYAIMIIGMILGVILTILILLLINGNGLGLGNGSGEKRAKAYAEEHVGREHGGRIIAYKNCSIDDNGDAEILFESNLGTAYDFGKISEIMLDKSGNILLCSICSYLEMQDNYRQYGQDNYSAGRTDYSNDYLFPSDRVYISESDLDYRGQYEISLIRNEIYARHGYVFKTEPYKSYFESKSWYYPNEYFSDGSFNDVEKANVKFITEYEKAMGWR